jgi:DNA polymerase IV
VTRTKYGDELDAVIVDAKKLPFLDENDEPSSQSVEDDDTDTGTEDERQESPRKKAPRANKDQTFGFQCMNKNDGTAKETNPNKRTIEILSEMEEYYTRTRDQWRSMSYRKAVATLRKQDKKICFASEAKKLPNIGDRLAAKIEEIVRTDHLQRLDYAKIEPGDETLKLFLGVYGAGLKRAQQWIAKGHKTLQDLLDKEKLSESQRIGVERHADFAQRIPRAEVRQHGELVIKTALEIDEDLVLEIMGSYRRVCLSLEVSSSLCD